MTTESNIGLLIIYIYDFYINESENRSVAGADPGI